MVAIVWQFTVKKGHETDFEALLSGDGDWNVMNRQTRSFLGSSFLRDQNQPSQYVLIEYWSEMLVYEQHRSYRADAIDSLERRRDAFVESMIPLGIFTALHVPERTGPTWSQRR